MASLMMESFWSKVSDDATLQERICSLLVADRDEAIQGIAGIARGEG